MAELTSIPDEPVTSSPIRPPDPPPIETCFSLEERIRVRQPRRDIVLNIQPSNPNHASQDTTSILRRRNVNDDNSSNPPSPLPLQSLHNSDTDDNAIRTNPLAQVSSAITNDENTKRPEPSDPRTTNGQPSLNADDTRPPSPQLSGTNAIIQREPDIDLNGTTGDETDPQMRSMKQSHRSKVGIGDANIVADKSAFVGIGHFIDNPMSLQTDDDGDTTGGDSSAVDDGAPSRTKRSATRSLKRAWSSRKQSFNHPQWMNALEFQTIITECKQLEGSPIGVARKARADPNAMLPDTHVSNINDSELTFHSLAPGEMVTSHVLVFYFGLLRDLCECCPDRTVVVGNSTWPLALSIGGTQRDDLYILVDSKSDIEGNSTIKSTGGSSSMDPTSQEKVYSLIASESVRNPKRHKTRVRDSVKQCFDTETGLSDDHVLMLLTGPEAPRKLRALKQDPGISSITGACDQIIIPIHWSAHFSLLVMYGSGVAVHLDSLDMDERNSSVQKFVKQIWRVDGRKLSATKFYSYKFPDLPKQTQSSMDCGVFVAMFATSLIVSDYLWYDRRFTSHYRLFMEACIRSGSLLGITPESVRINNPLTQVPGSHLFVKGPDSSPQDFPQSICHQRLPESVIVEPLGTLTLDGWWDKFRMRPCIVTDTE